MDSGDSNGSRSRRTSLAPHRENAVSRFLAWFVLSVVVASLPFAGALAVLPRGRPWHQIFLHGDAFIFVVTLLAATALDLFFSSVGKLIKTVLLALCGVTDLGCVFLFVAAVGNEAARTENLPEPFPRISADLISQLSLWLGGFSIVISAWALVMTSIDEPVGKETEGV